jgi:hypothetical protein
MELASEWAKRSSAKNYHILFKKITVLTLSKCLHFIATALHIATEAATRAVLVHRARRLCTPLLGVLPKV